MFRKITITLLALTVLVTAFGASAQSATSTVCTQSHTVARGETLYRISRRYGTTVATLQSINGIANANRISTGQVLCVQQATVGNTTYVVQRGDRLSRIAQRYGISMSVLAQVNGISDPNRIYAGQVLVIPEVTIQ
jgi:lysozyme